MENKEITLQLIYDTMLTKFEQIDERFDGIDRRITKIDAENKESHKAIFDELRFTNNSLTRMETDYSQKIGILFDAEQAHKERQSLFSSQQLRFQDQLDDLKFRIINLETKAFAN